MSLRRRSHAEGLGLSFKLLRSFSDRKARSSVCGGGSLSSWDGWGFGLEM